MTPAEFLNEVAHPNMVGALETPDDLRAIVNAILTLDALAGLIHAHGLANQVPEIARYERDDGYREALACISHSFRVLRDTAASMKHGKLSDPRKRGSARLIRAPASLRARENGLGLFRAGDEVGGEVIVIEYDTGPGYLRASSAVADTYRMLRRIVEGHAPQTDEHDDRP
ncbi:hypothetical protein [Methylobacterium goesingense]|uniref:Uncharacterized protein n=1 Tax=Methylobacterium goesingense TaxID=243690 RepID=A0ABV2LC01_9HYPH|nr:hypothetical protein [Methylobacterium goesingense]